MRFIYLIFAMLAFVIPWPIGGNWPFSRTAALLVCFCLLMLAFWEILKNREGQSRVAKVPKVCWALLAGIAFTHFQSSPLSSTVQLKFGRENLPVSAALNFDTYVNSGTNQLRNTLATARPISVYPAATRRRLVDLIYGVGLFVAASVVLIGRRQIIPLLLALVGTGAAISFLGIVQRISGDRRIFWQYDLLWGGNPFGTFVNANNASGFLAICFSAAVFFVTYQLSNWSKNKNEKSLPLESGWESGTEGHGSIFSKCVELVIKLQPSHLYFLAAVAIIVAGVFVTLSRGGMLAILASFLAAVALNSKINRLIVVCLALLLFALAAGLASFSDQSASISNEIQTLSDLSNAAAPRLDHWRDAVPFGLKNGLLGCGNGTYRFVSPIFQSFYLPNTFAHAESVYIETLVELGWGGVGLLMFAGVFCFHSSISLVRRPDNFDCALGVSAVTCLIGQAVIALFDFGIYQPANTTAMAMLMGATVGRHCCIENRSKRKSSVPSFKLKSLRLSIVLVLMVCSGWAIYESYGIESYRAAQRTIKQLNSYGSRGIRETRGIRLEKVEQQLRTAKLIRPDDADVHFQFGELHVARYRQLETKQLAETIRLEIERIELSDAPAKQKRAEIQRLEKMDAKAIWNASAVPFLHRRLRKAERSSPEVAARIKSEQHVQDHLGKAMSEFQLAEQCCSRLSKTQYRLALLCALVSSANARETLTMESDHIQLALRRSIPKAQLLFNCGLLSLNSGDQVTAIELWRKCLSGPHRVIHERAIVDFCQQELPMRLFYEEVLPQSPKELIRIAGRYFASPQLLLAKKFLINHARRRIAEEEDLDELTRILLLAEASTLVNDYPEVVLQYSKALSLASSPAPWRSDYAFALIQTKQFDEAVRQLKMCELDPGVRKNRIKYLLAKIRRERSK